MTTTASDFKSLLLERGVVRTYTIAFSPRSGSTLLCDLLAKNGWGQPTEYFQYPFESNIYLSGAEGNTQIERLLSLITKYSSGGYFASKIAHDHRARLEELFRNALPDYDGFESVLPSHEWIYLKRRQIIAQAISLFIAEQSQTWQLRVDTDIPVDFSLAYDFLSILSKLLTLAANNINWDYYFASRNCIPLRIDFDELSPDPTNCLSVVARHIGACSNQTRGQFCTATNLLRFSGVYKATYSLLYRRFLDDFLKLGQSDDRTRIGKSLQIWDEFFLQKKWLSGAPCNGAASNGETDPNKCDKYSQ